MIVDLRHLLRNLRRSPSSAIAAILTLSLTLGAGASIFAVVDAVLLTPPPFAEPGALVRLAETPLDDPASTPRSLSYATLDAWRERAGPLAAIEAFDGTNLTLTELGAAERVSATNVTPRFLTLLGIVPAIGRAFDDRDANQPVVIVRHAFWRARLSADANAIGRQLVLGNQAHTIVGVLPERFFFALNACDLWRPLPLTADEAARTGFRIHAIARVSRPLSATDLRAALDDVSRASSPPSRVVATPIERAIAGDASGTLALLAGAAALAMLIAFTNLAGLLVVRSIDRRRELAVRSALGARPIEIARQLLFEAQALVALGTAGGILLALWMTPIVGRLALQQFGGIASREVMVSWRVVAALSVVASVCAWICGLLPAFVAARQSAIDVLRRGTTPPPRERQLRRALVAGEVALAFVLLVAVALLGRSLFGVLRVNPGFDAHGVIALNVSLPAASYAGNARVAAFYNSLQSQLEERFEPGTVSIVDELPLTGDRGRSLVSAHLADAGREAVVRTAAAGYFETMRIPIAAGRPFNRDDNASAPPRAIVSESLAERLFGREPPIGRFVRLATLTKQVEIVGVAGDVKHRALDEPLVPTVYLPAPQAPSHSTAIVVRSRRPAADVIVAVREEVARLDPNLPVYAVRSMDEVVAASPGVPARQVLTATFTAFALLAVVLGGLGLFGAAAHDVASRRAELALRIALGADPSRILRATIGQGAVIVAFGLAAGGVLSIWISRALRGLILGTGGMDLLSVGIPAAILIASGIGAVLPAAFRAARTDPLSGLRSE